MTENNIVSTMISKPNRRIFLESILMSAAVTALGGRSSVQGAPSVWTRPPDSTLPVEMLVLGDSVMWGQGLNEEEKLYTLVKDKLETELINRRVNLTVRAHSGATILPQDGKCILASGEVDILTPTITNQIALALDDYKRRGLGGEDVGLILINGGINDIGVPRLLNFLTTGPGRIRELAQKHCGSKMKDLLLQAMAAFPNATVIVPGYFPIISNDTDPNFIRNLILAFFGRDDRRELEVIEAVDGSDRAADSTFIRDRLAVLSQAWEAESSESLQWAVDEVNKAFGGARRPTSSVDPGTLRKANLLPQGARSRVFFVRPNFGPRECYAAPETHFWKITGSNPHQGQNPNASRLLTDDHKFATRQAECLQPRFKGLRLQVCQVAGTGHPNVFGAKKYANAITAKLREVLRG